MNAIHDVTSNPVIIAYKSLRRNIHGQLKIAQHHVNVGIKNKDITTIPN